MSPATPGKRVLEPSHVVRAELRRALRPREVVRREARRHGVGLSRGTDDEPSWDLRCSGTGRYERTGAVVRLCEALAEGVPFETRAAERVRPIEGHLRERRRLAGDARERPLAIADHREALVDRAELHAHERDADRLLRIARARDQHLAAWLHEALVEDAALSRERLCRHRPERLLGEQVLRRVEREIHEHGDGQIKPLVVLEHPREDAELVRFDDLQITTTIAKP